MHALRSFARASTAVRASILAVTSASTLVAASAPSPSSAVQAPMPTRAPKSSAPDARSESAEAGGGGAAEIGAAVRAELGFGKKDGMDASAWRMACALGSRGEGFESWNVVVTPPSGSVGVYAGDATVHFVRGIWEIAYVWRAPIAAERTVGYPSIHTPLSHDAKESELYRHALRVLEHTLDLDVAARRIAEALETVWEPSLTCIIAPHVLGLSLVIDGRKNAVAVRMPDDRVVVVFRSERVVPARED